MSLKSYRNAVKPFLSSMFLSLLMITVVLASPLTGQTSDGEAETGSVVYLPVIAKPNLPPRAQITVTANSGTAPFSVKFDASASKDEDGQVKEYSWDFGGGVTSRDPVVRYDYTTPGAYTVRLGVTDNLGLTGWASVQIQAREPAMMAKNVILFIGDGMGFEHVRAGGMYLNGVPGTLSFEKFPYRAQMSTGSASSSVTDSAAAATAMATGVKVQNEILSIAIPGNGRELYTILEYARDQGLSTGLVTTTTITHATPAGFGAHSVDRGADAEIAQDYFSQTRPNVIFGGGAAGISVEAAQAAGYQVITDLTGLQAINTEGLPLGGMYLSGQFGSGYMPYERDGLGSLPHLSQMTTSALNILDNDPDGFFLMVEGGRIDHASHVNDAARMVGEVAEFSRAVEQAVEWSKQHPETLIAVVADHETGGLATLYNTGAGSTPQVSWTTIAHTGRNVPVYLYGTFYGTLPVIIDNTQIPSLLSAGKFPGN